MPDQSLDNAVALHQAGKLQEAAAEYRKLLNLRPQDPDILHLFGVLLAQTGKPKDGAEMIQQAIKLRPHVAVFYSNMGYALQMMGRPDIAAMAYRQAAAIEPQSPTTWFNLGQCLAKVFDTVAAVEAFKRAIALKPDYAQAHNDLGAILREHRNIDEALACFRRAVEIDPKFAEAHHNLALALANSGRVHEAVEFEARASELAPDVAAPASGKCYMVQFDPHFDRAAICREMGEFNRRFGLPLAADASPHANNRDPDRPLKIGYVSPDFWSQAESFFVLPLLQNHRHDQFQIHCYSSVKRPDAVTREMKKYADAWHEVAHESDEQLANRIRTDGMDILVDLTMHMRDNRLAAFARKPAPIQVTWLAYPGGTGLTAIDYRITDAFLDPPDCDQFYAEKSIRLPCWCCYDPHGNVPIEPSPPKDFIRFASFNAPAKMNDLTLDLWSRVLAAVPNSQLLLLITSNEHRQRITEFFGRAGIDSGRLEYSSYLARPEYLATLGTVDLCLDPLPYNGITTTLDALWMGIPIVNLVSETAPGRAGLCLLTHAGLGEFVAKTADEFVEIAARGRTISREDVRTRLQNSPLMNGSEFSRNIENAYREMWRNYVASFSTATGTTGKPARPGPS